MPQEIRIMREASVAWVQASAAAAPAWTTASAPRSGVFAYIDAFGVTSAATVIPVFDRGAAKHWKQTQEDVLGVTLTTRWTGYWPTGIETAEGATLPLIHLEFKSLETELGGGTARFIQIYNVPWNSIAYTVAAEGDTNAMTFQSLGMLLTASGYLANHLT